MKLDAPDIEIRYLQWNASKIEHIKEHNISPRQVEQVFIEGKYLAGEGKKSKLLIHGRCGRRLLTVVLAQENGSYYVITARNMNRKERERYYEIYTKEDDKQQKNSRVQIL